VATLPNAYFTPESILTLSGATGAVYVVCGAVQHVFGVNPRWLALAISLAIAVVGAYTTQPPVTATFLIAIVNGCLIYCTSVGVNSVFGTRQQPVIPKGAGVAPPASPPKRTFRSRWL
jgi:hypothetical protein